MARHTEPTTAPPLLAEVVITRTFAAPRSLVFKAWTDPAMVARWWGPRGFTTLLCELDVRPGGVIRIDMRGPDGVVIPVGGEYREIVDPERLVFTCAPLDDDGDVVVEVVNAVTFVEREGKTVMTLTASAFGGAELAPYTVGMNEGWTESIDRLEAFVATVAEGPASDRRSAS